MFGKVKSMKRRILSVALAVTMVAALFTGCGKAKKTETTEIDVKKIDFKTNQKLTDKDVELTVWESLAGPDEFIQRAGEYFTELYPNIKIKFANVESTEANSKIVLDGPGGNGPDLFATAHNNTGVMVASAAIEKIPDEEKDIIANSCTPQALQGATLNAADGTSTLYGLPVSVETAALFYNKDLIKEDEIPKTMSDMVTYMNDFTKNNPNKKPFLFDAGNAYYSVMFTSSPSVHLYGENGNDITNSYMNSDESVKQMQDFVALAKATGMKSGDIDYKHNDSLFADGQLAMDISGAWNIKTFEESGVNFGITSIPALTGSTNPPTNFMGVRCMYVSAYSKHKPEAIAFGEFLMTKEMQQLRCEITSTMPARDGIVDKVNDEKIKVYLKGIEKQIAFSYPMPNMAQASKFWTPFATAYGNIWNGEVTDVKAELDTANQSATKKK